MYAATSSWKMAPTISASRTRKRKNFMMPSVAAWHARPQAQF
jgi:hypothetical protein